MRPLFHKRYSNVLEKIDQGLEREQAESSNFLGIAIGKKAIARKQDRKKLKAEQKKYKLESRRFKSENDRIRAHQGMPKENIVGDIAKGITGIASTLMPGAGGGVLGGLLGGGGKDQEQLYPPPPPPKKNNTLLILAALGVLAIVLLIIFKRKN